MNGILIYTEEEARRNAFAVEKITGLLEIPLVISGKDGIPDKIDFAVNRTDNAEIAEALEGRGVRVFNPYSLSLLANDKRKCYEFMQKNGIEIMPINQATTPVVEKPIDGKGGKNVSLITENGFEIKEGYVYQKPASDMGRDLRVWLIGGEIISSILRVNNNDFRSNFCLGGEAHIYNMSKDEQRLVQKIASLLEYDYIGMDFVFDNGRAVFNEIEDAVGARMVYEKTDIDILKLYCDYIKSEMGK